MQGLTPVLGKIGMGRSCLDGSGGADQSQNQFMSSALER